MVLTSFFLGSICGDFLNDVILRVVVFDEILEGLVAEASVKIVLLHFVVRLLKAPVVEPKTINSSHCSRAVTSAGAVYEEFARRRIVDCLQKSINRFSRGIFFPEH